MTHIVRGAATLAGPARHRRMARLGSALALAVTLAGGGTLITGALPVSPAQAASPCDNPVIAGAPCLNYAVYLPNNGLVVPPGCLACVQVEGQDYASDPVLVSAVDSGTGLLLAQAKTVADAQGTFTTQLALTQSSSNSVLIFAVDLTTQMTSNTLTIFPIPCKGC